MGIFNKQKKETDKQEPVIELTDKVQDEAVERGQTHVGVSKKASSKVQALVVAMGVILTLLLGVSSFIALTGDDEKKPENTQTVETSSSPRANFDAEMARLMQQTQDEVVQEQTERLEVEEPQIEQPQSQSNSQVQQVAQISTETQAQDPDELRRLGGNVMVSFDAQSQPVQVRENTSLKEDGSALNDKMTKTITPSVIANRRGDQTYLLRKGTTVACTLHSKIITTQPGFTRCIVNKDVYSANGRVLLIERGSEIIGEQTAGLTQGQTRIFIMWNTIETPKGVHIEIDSPSSDALGAAGQEAQVDTHFWERFGGAVMLSMVDDIMGIASNRIDNQDYRFENTQENVQSMAEEALRNTINIPPTGYVNQGSLLNIIVARDVDFRGVYELVHIN